MMIQDIYPDTFDNHYTEQSPAPDSPMLFFRNDQLLARHDAVTHAILFPVCSDFPQGTEAVYLFSVSGRPYFGVKEPAAVPDGFEWYSLKDLRMLERNSNTGPFAAFTGWHLWKWYTSSRFCGACGEETVYDHQERAKVCPVCGNRIYPRINPAVIVGITNGERILLTKYNRTFAYNALVAGFTEIGETMEETVQREVMEEVGLKVKNIRYYKSQPWGIALDILMGFFCDVDGDDTIRRDDSELKYAAWVERPDIVLQPTEDSLTNEMMRLFKEKGYQGTVADRK